MPSDLEFTGERFVPGIAGEIAHEHWHRYAFARRFVAGLSVLDVACGEGYGSALLANGAGSVLGVDIAEGAITHASAAYADRANLRFAQGSASSLPVADGAFDVVVSFETIEHLPQTEQSRMVAEIGRVLRPDGILILSAPNPVEYSQARGYVNPFHLHEPSREEIDALLAGTFAARRWHRQRRYYGSALWSEGAATDRFEAFAGDSAGVDGAAPPPAMYYVVIAARTAACLPPPGPALSLFSDRDEAEIARMDARAAEVLRLDSLLVERDTALDRQSAHVRSLEDLVAFRERVVVERDEQLASVNAAREQAVAERDAAQRNHAAVLSEIASAQQSLAAMAAECARLERALAAQERIIVHRQSMRWWLTLPWMRAKLWWRHVLRA
jgi:2-polyprenyl-3-methyl-5-hydroxy-6-metoxy-1,4-benzoquinol methylase